MRLPEDGGISRAIRPIRPRSAWVYWAALFLLSSLFVVRAYSALSATLADPERAERFTTDDASRYLKMAEAFAAGRVPVPGNKQPLYPALLGLVIKAGVTGRLELGLVNVAIGVCGIWLLYAMGGWLFERRWIGLVAATCYATSGFVVANIASALLTEPTFLFFALLAAGCALKYLMQPRSRYLYAASLAAGMSYLARPNGLFLVIAVWTVLFLNDLLRWQSARRGVSIGAGLPGVAPRGQGSPAGSGVGHGIALRFLLAALMVVAVTSPSWVARMVYRGHPLDHGTLSNYLWVDSFEEGHVPGPPRFGPAHYLARHDWRDVVSRSLYGLHHVFYVTPASRGAWLYPFAMAGFVMAVASRKRAYTLFSLLMVVQASPLVWTAMSNPDKRIHYGAILPFAILYVAILATECERLAGATWPWRSLASDP